LTKSAKYPSYAGDLWKSKAKKYYVAISLHFIDESWILRSPLIAFKQIIGPHTADAVGSLCADVLKDFLGDGVTPFSGVFDGGDIKSVDYTADTLQCTIEKRRCVCHILNNAIKKIILEFFGHKKHIEDWRCFVSRINFSNGCKESWDTICKVTYGKTITLCKDSATRWSSTVVMLRSALQVKKAVVVMRATDKKNHVSTFILLIKTDTI
jgi:hypothetical protein